MERAVMSLEVNEMNFLGTVISIIYYLIPVAVPLAILYKLELRMSSDFVIFAVIFCFVLLFFVDAILPLRTSFSIQALMSTISKQYLSSLPMAQREQIIKILLLLIHTLITTIVLVPIGILLKITRGE